MPTDRELAEWAHQLARIEAAAEQVFRDRRADASERASAEAVYRIARPAHQRVKDWISARSMRAALRT